MAGKSSANENKVFAMSVSKPSIKLGKSGRGASFAWKSGRGGVFCVSLLSTVTHSLFSFFGRFL